MTGRLSNVLRRGTVYYFRRLVPVALRPRVGRIELVRSLSTNCRSSARLFADRLYSQSEQIFAAAAIAMFPPDKISAMVRDFYSLALEIDDYRRWFSAGPDDDSQLAERTEFLTGVLADQKDALRRNDFAKVNLPAEVILSRHKLSQDRLNPGEFNQLRQALLRASIDLATDLLARQDGQFELQPQSKLFNTPTNSVPVTPASSPSPAISAPGAAPSVTPSFSEIGEAFRSEQLAVKRWDNQTAVQARATYRLFVDVCGDRPLAAYTRLDADKFRKNVQLLPHDYGKAAMYRGLSVDETLKKASAKAELGEVRPITQRTVKRHFSALSAVWTAALSAGTVEQNIFSGFRFANTKKPTDQRDMWTSNELQALFASPLYVLFRGMRTPFEG